MGQTHRERLLEGNKIFFMIKRNVSKTYWTTKLNLCKSIIANNILRKSLLSNYGKSEHISTTYRHRWRMCSSGLTGSQTASNLSVLSKMKQIEGIRA